jgi:YggT family protein
MPRDYDDRQERVRGDRSWSGDGREGPPYEAEGRGTADRAPRERRSPLEPGPAETMGTPHQGEMGRDPDRPEGVAEVRRDVTTEEVRPRQIEPNTVAVERRDGERRVVDEPVAEDRRMADRRADRERAAVRARETRSYAISRVMMGVDYLFYLLYGLLAVRFVLALLGASETAGFVQFINGVTQPFYAPFAGIVARPAMNGGVLDFPLLIAILAYALLHMAVRGLLRLMRSPRA